MRSQLSVVAMLFALFAIAVPVHAQTPSGEISGTVVDSERPAGPGRDDHAHQPGDERRPRRADQRGRPVRDLRHPARDLRLEGRAGGIPDRRAEGHRRAGRQREPDRRSPWMWATLTETSTVVGPLAIDPDGERGHQHGHRKPRIVELPLNGRNYLQLASLIPGATTNGPSSSQGKQRMGGQRNSFALNVAGQRIHFNHYSLDGVENTDLNFNSYMLLPSVDALEEFNVVSGIFDAEYGRAIAQVNVSHQVGLERVSRHGVRVPAQLHARREELLRPADNPIPPFKRNQYRVHAERPGGAAEDRRRPEQAVLHVQLGRAAREQVADADALAAADRLAHRRFLEPARRERQPDPDLRSGHARVRRGRQRAAGADGVSRQHHSGQSDSSGLAEAARLLPARRARR